MTSTWLGSDLREPEKLKDNIPKIARTPLNGSTELHVLQYAYYHTHFL